MALLFFDGFDQYDANTDLTSFGGWATATGNVSTSSTVAFGSGKSLLLSWQVANVLIYTFADQAAKTVYAGFRFMRTNATLSGERLLSFIQTGTTEQFTINLNSSAHLEIRASTGGTVLATGTATLSLNVWNYIEVKGLVANSGGVIEVRVDSVVDATYSGDTQNQATDSVVSIAWHAFATPTYLIDDLYILNSDGSANNTYLGEQRCEIMAPTSDSSVAWTRNTGASNFAAVDDSVGAPDDDTTYVASSTSTQKDEYGLGDLTGVGAVAGVKLITRAEKDDANPLSFKAGIKSGATDQQITHSLSTGYVNYIDLFETSDGGSTAFTSTTVNSLLSTIEVV